MTVTSASANSRVDVARIQLPRVAAIRPELLVDERRAIGKRRLRVGDGVKRLVVDLDQFGGVLGPRAAPRGDDGDAVPGVPGDVDGERRVVRVVRVLVGIQAQGRLPSQSSARSAPDQAATTSACASAGATSTFVMRAWAYGLRTTARYTMSGARMLSTH